MDDTDWTATGSFSPSKAKLAQAQAKDWSFIDAWLAKKYVSSKVPAFERNEDTLGALLALISLNEAADERRRIVERVEKSALQYYTRQKGEPGDVLYRSITEHLYQAGHDSVETLAQTSLSLNTPCRNGIGELGAAVVNLQIQVFDLEQVERSARDQATTLRSEHQRLLDLLAHLRSDAFKAPDGLVEDTAQWLKGTKHLRAKIGEYDERLAATPSAQSLLSLLDEARRALLEANSLKATLVELEHEIEALRNFLDQPATAGRLLNQQEDEVAALRSASNGGGDEKRA